MVNDIKKISGTIQEVHEEGDEYILIVYEQRTNKLRAVHLNKSKYDERCSNPVPEGAKVKMFLNQQTGEVERIGFVFEKWFSTIRESEEDKHANYDHRDDFI